MVNGCFFLCNFFKNVEFGHKILTQFNVIKHSINANTNNLLKLCQRYVYILDYDMFVPNLKNCY